MLDAKWPNSSLREPGELIIYILLLTLAHSRRLKRFGFRRLVYRVARYLCV